MREMSPTSSGDQQSAGCFVFPKNESTYCPHKNSKVSLLPQPVSTPSGTMSDQNLERKPRRLVRVLTLTLIVHLIFIGQLIVAMDQKGLVLPEFGFLFFPHTLLMYFLPPGFDFANDQISYLRLIGKILDAAPASLAYG